MADCGRAVLVWEKPYYPTYYFPIADVRIELLVPDSGVSHSPSRGDGTLYTVTAGGRTATGAAVRYEQSPIPELRISSASTGAPWITGSRRTRS